MLSSGLAAGNAAVVLFRPEALSLAAASASANRIAATLRHSMFLGTFRECVFMAGSTPIVMAMDDARVPAAGTAAQLSVEPDDVLIFVADQAAS